MSASRGRHHARTLVPLIALGSVVAVACGHAVLRRARSVQDAVRRARTGEDDDEPGDA